MNSITMNLITKPLNDVGNAERIAEAAAGSLAWAPSVGWFSLNDGQWRKLSRSKSWNVAAGLLLRQLRKEAQELEQVGPHNKETSEEFALRIDRHRRWIDESGNVPRLKAALSLAKYQMEASVNLT